MIIYAAYCHDKDKDIVEKCSLTKTLSLSQTFPYNNRQSIVSLCKVRAIEIAFRVFVIVTTGEA